MLVERARAAGYDPGQVMAMSRHRPDGLELYWRNTLPPATAGGVIPFVIDWGSANMPSATVPSGLELVSFEARHPDPATVRAAHDAMGFEVDIITHEAAGLFAALRGPSGAVSLGPAVRRPI